jgi:hypothetical protein
MGAPNRSSPLLPDATSEEQPTVRLQNHGDFEGSGIWVVMIIDPWPDPQYAGKYDHRTACHSRYQQDQHSRVRNSASNQQNMLMLFAIAAEVSQQQCSAQVEVDPA